ncbi:MAG: tryptophan synthase subunit alpha [Fibrobacter sp.]|nr:tryptophan synthase subunit alpha [Fibrobacter sp.]
MNRISQKFAELKNRQEKALVAYITAGDPDYERSLELISAACANGVDILELGVPFSDPTADGPVIQEAAIRALSTGMNIEKSFKMVADIRVRFPQLPIVLFSYYNPLFQYDAAELFARCQKVGVDGLLVVDLPPEEAQEITAHFPNPAALPLIRLVAPTTPVERKQRIAHDAQGFLYLITRTGVTGTGGLDVDYIAHHARELRAQTSVPICLGFGISTAKDIRQLAPHADGLIVGSALVKLVAEHKDNPDLTKIIAQAVCELKAACK